jgi:capsular exopolysaccharide synthesis family protein
LEKSLLVKKTPEGTDLSRERLASIQTKRSALLLRRMELRSQLDRIEAALQQGCDRETILTLIAEFAQKAEQPDIARTPAALTPDQLTTLLLEEQKLLERFGADHPEVRSVRQRIAIARKILVIPATAWDGQKDLRLGDPVQRHVRILGQKLRHSSETEESLRRLLEAEQEEARKLARYEIQDESFRTSITLTRQSYEALNKRLQEAHLMRNAGGYDVEVVSPPSEGRKIAPSLALFLAVAAVLGVLASLGLAAVRETTCRRLRSVNEVRQLGLPILGCIPFVKGEGMRKARPGSPRVDPLLCAHHQPRSEEAEAYRSLRNALFFQAGGPVRKVLQITSPGCGDGKSILAANLAVSMAQGGKKVILVEADWHRPRLTELFRLTPAGGLVQVLIGERGLKAAIEESSIAGLSILFAGPPPRPTADLLPSSSFQELLDRLRESYEFIVVDTPGLLASAEAAAVAARADGVLLAVRLSRNARPALERSLDVLATVGADVLGVVVTDASPGTRSTASFGPRGGYQDGRWGTDVETASNGSDGAADERRCDAVPSLSEAPSRAASSLGPRSASCAEVLSRPLHNADIPPRTGWGDLCPRVAMPSGPARCCWT